MKRVTSELGFNGNSRFYGNLVPQDEWNAMRKELHSLHQQVLRIQKKLNLLEYEKSQWTLKYSRRLVQVSNVVLSIYVMLRRLGLFWSGHKNLVWTFLLPRFKKFPLLLERIQRKITKKGISGRRLNMLDFQVLIIRFFWKEVGVVAFMGLSTYWLQKNPGWKRRMGLLLSFLVNIFVSTSMDVKVFVTYFNIFTLLTYLTARNYKYVLPQDIDQMTTNIIKSFRPRLRRTP